MKSSLKSTLFTLSLCAAVSSAQAVSIPSDVMRTAHLTVGQKITHGEITAANYHPSFSYKSMNKKVLGRRDWVEMETYYPEHNAIVLHKQGRLVSRSPYLSPVIEKQPEEPIFINHRSYAQAFLLALDCLFKIISIKSF